MEFKWVVEESIWITDSEFEDMVNVTQIFIREGYKREEAITAAVTNYLSEQDDYVFHYITEEVTNQIENEVNKRFT